jgi:hypothetical protein
MTLLSGCVNFGLLMSSLGGYLDSSGDRVRDSPSSMFG